MFVGSSTREAALPYKVSYYFGRSSAEPLVSQQCKGFKLLLLPCFFPKPQVLITVVVLQVAIQMWLVPKPWTLLPGLCILHTGRWAAGRTGHIPLPASLALLTYDEETRDWCRDLCCKGRRNKQSCRQNFKWVKRLFWCRCAWSHLPVCQGLWSMLLQIFLHGAARLGKMDRELEKGMSPEEASFAVCLYPLLALVPASVLLRLQVRISSSEAEIRQTAPGGGEGSKRGDCLMLFCMSRRNARGQELVLSEEGRCQGQGSGEQLWLLWSLTWMIRCCYKFAVGQQKCSTPKPKGAWALPALMMLLLVNSQAPVQEQQFREVQQSSVTP